VLDQSKNSNLLIEGCRNNYHHVPERCPDRQIVLLHQPTLQADSTVVDVANPNTHTRCRCLLIA
jgi:hypothetical protein